MASYVYPRNDISYGHQGILRDERPAFDHAMKPGAQRAIGYAESKELFEEGRYPFDIALPSSPVVCVHFSITG